MIKDQLTIHERVRDVSRLLAMGEGETGQREDLTKDIRDHGGKDHGGF